MKKRLISLLLSFAMVATVAVIPANAEFQKVKPLLKTPSLSFNTNMFLMAFLPIHMRNLALHIKISTVW